MVTFMSGFLQSDSEMEKWLVSQKISHGVCILYIRSNKSVRLIIALKMFKMPGLFFKF
jgi:hypothetical protein